MASKREIVLAVLAAAGGANLTPTQLQKAAFLITTKIPEAFDNASTFSFTPYNYGPFDAAVYREAELLASSGLAEIVKSMSGNWKEYSASQNGVAAGNQILASLDQRHRNYIENVVAWVRQLTFQQLVKSIYDAYPEMRANSIFNG